VYEQFPLF